MKILLTGGSGLLGSALMKLANNIDAPSRLELDVLDGEACSRKLSKDNYDVVIHAAAMTDNRLVEKEPDQAVMANIIGTSNVAVACLRWGVRMVYISTDYVYQGDRGNYLESDPVLPFNLYAWTKLGGECAVRALKNYLIIRTSFGGAFKYDKAFVDKWTSKDYVDVIAPMILEAVLSPLTGMLNLGTERKTLYDHAVETNTAVKRVKLAETNFNTPYDTSLNLQKWINYKSSKAVAKPHNICRCCGSVEMEKYLDLGLMPLANNLEFTAQRAREKDRYPLQVLFCKSCGLSQLSVVIDPEVMFSYYTYRSSINAGYVQHCRDMAESVIPLFEDKFVGDGVRTGRVPVHKFFHIDIAGNDGTLLKQFKEYLGYEPYYCLNIDPATNLTAIAEANGIPSLTEFWSVEVAERFAGQVDLITATNVFAHVDDMRQFILAVKFALAPDGLLVLEFPYLPNFIEGTEFDTVYFEHLSYVMLGPVCDIAKSMKLVVRHAELVNIHGGSIRIIISKSGEQDYTVSDWLDYEDEEGYKKLETYKNWSSKVHQTIHNFAHQLTMMKKEGAKIAAFAASAKGNTLLNCAGMTTDIIDFIADETPEKIGKFSPGTGIPIVNKMEIQKQRPDYIVILSWNFADDIIAKIRALGFEGQFIMPIPEFQIV